MMGVRNDEKRLKVKNMTKDDIKTLFENHHDGLKILLWQEVKFIKRYFNGDYKRLYESLSEFSKFRKQHIQPEDFDRMWKDIRTFDTQFKQDRTVIRKFFFNNDNYKSEIDGFEFIKPLNHGTLIWTNKNNDKKEIRFSRHYLFDIEIVSSVFDNDDVYGYVTDFNSDYFSYKMKKTIKNYINGLQKISSEETTQEKKEVTKMNENITTTEYPQEENVFQNVPKVVDKYSYFAKDTTSNARLADAYIKRRNNTLICHTSEFRKVESMIINRCRRSKSDAKEITEKLAEENIILNYE